MAESLNFAALHRLPILFICENNGYAIHEPLAKRWATNRLCERVATYGIPARRIEGQDVYVIREGAGEAVDRARRGEGPSFHVSTQAGSVRQTERHLHSDPPTAEELEAAREEIRAIVDGAVPADVRRSVADGVAVAGTPTSVAAIDQQLDPYDPARVHGYRVSIETCERIARLLAELPESERRQVTGLHPERAPTIVAGTIILVETMRSFGLASIEVGEHDILYGAAVKAAG